MRFFQKKTTILGVPLPVFGMYKPQAILARIKVLLMPGFYIGDEFMKRTILFMMPFWLQPPYPPSDITASYNLSLSHSSLCEKGRGLPTPAGGRVGTGAK
jgi:hypothetical protein